MALPESSLGEVAAAREGATVERSYEYYRDALRGQRMPCAWVDLELLDGNIRAIRDRAGGKTIRVASKSVRCRWVLRRIFDGDPVYRGIMSFNPHEAVFLSCQGFDDILLGYPCWREDDVKAVCCELKKGKSIILMIDSEEHVKHLNHIGKAEGATIPVCIDGDMSSSYPGLHFGVRRSPIREGRDLAPVLDAIEASEHVELKAFMGYEAQIAGLPDTHPAAGLKNVLIRFLKGRSVNEVAHRRAELLETLGRRGFRLEIVNGGGTGSMESTREEAGVTEVTVGSGFFSPTLFDHYTKFRHSPAAGYAIEIVRRPKQGLFTCAGGGYVASGVAGLDKVPEPFLPEGAALLSLECAGEVQTPIAYAGPVGLGLGDPIFMRHSKAGELCERFNTLLVIAGGKVVDEVPTYRGEGECFL